MSRNYDNWERLVAAVLRREELWLLCHDHSRSPSISSIASDLSSSWSSPSGENLSSGHPENDHSNATQNWAVWEKQFKPGVHITLAALPDGTRFVKRVRFSQVGFEEEEAVIWWFKNRERVYRKYNAWGGNARIRRPLVVSFSWSPLIDPQEDESIFVPEVESISENSDPCEHQPGKIVGSEGEQSYCQPEEQSTRAFDLSETEMLSTGTNLAVLRHRFPNKNRNLLQQKK
ncbi:UNVERIFIED_CONTAM: PH, RCC1 and FYVE domains-containing protein 1 [Sesamum angustifolium]|uniref:PH, RCC1 and FYVE domains-containing protein 1 n=1 Tax=Sesamum angustifolium TaxID=2727405 RepID=A0AAW2NHE4_9LAMI